APVPVTLRTHGYNTMLGSFEREVERDAAASAPETLRPDGRFYIGFRWPSEGVGTKASLGDALAGLLGTPSVGIALVAPPLAGLLSRLGGPFAGFAAAFFAPWLHRGLAAGLLGAGLLMLGIRLSTYARDRYRALHYGVPDLGEFMRDLERQLFPRGI